MKDSRSDVRERILDVAREMFINKGYTGTSVRDIATASGANVAHISYYFTSKDNLFRIIFEEAFDILIKKMFTVLDSDISFEELIRLWINTYYELLMEYPQIPIFIMHEINQNPERLTKTIQSHQPQDLFFRLSERVEREINRGAIRDIPSVDLILNVMSMCVFPFMSSKMAISVTNLSQGEYNTMLTAHKECVVEFVLNALRP